METLETGDVQCKDGTLNCAITDNCTNSSIDSYLLTRKLVQFEGNGAFVPASEDDAMEVAHLLAEPQYENAFRDVMSLNSEDAQNCLAIEDFTCTTDYYIGKGDCDIFASHIGHPGERELKYEFADSMFHTVTEEGNIQLTANISTVCPDYLLDTGSAEISELDHASCKGSRLANLDLECQTPSFEDRDEALEILPFSNSINSQPESTFDQGAILLDNMTVRELHDAFRDMFGRDTCVDDKQWLKRRILFGLQNIADLDNNSNILESRFSSDYKEDSMILIPGNDLARSISSSLTNMPESKASFASRDVANSRHHAKDVLAAACTEIQAIGFHHAGEMENALMTSKRLRKPTKRYIVETSETKGGDRLESPIADSKDKVLHVRADNQYLLGRSATFPMNYQVAPAKSGVQVPCGRRVRRGRPRKNTIPMGSDSKASNERKLWSVANRRNGDTVESDSHDDVSDDCDDALGNEKSGIRRKHHRLWTLSEVMKLVEGVSQYGVGRWTDIKRLLFSTSAHRTSVDLKDKWRNLLRASGVHLHGRHKVLPQKKHLTLPIPQSVLRRVKELAAIHPYPRERKSRPSTTAAKPLSLSSDTSSVSRSSRTTVHRRSCTLVS